LTLSFPPSAACNPMLSAAQFKDINFIESALFGLPEVSPVPSTFQMDCFPTRPVYGVLDVLRYRLPFADGVKQAPLQAAVLNPDASSRLLLRSGAALSAYPSVPSVNVSAFSAADYGTIDHMNHVLLAFLKSIPIAQAAALGAFIADATNSTLPPPVAIFNSTATTVESYPVIEVALFGAVGQTDYDYAVSSFSTPSGQLFFGSQDANVFREWAVVASTDANAAVVWTDTADASEVVDETAQAEPEFMGVWNAAGSLISNAYAVGTVAGPQDVNTVVAALHQIGYFS